MSVRAIARALGGDIVGPGRIAAPGPGHCRVDRSMSILIDPAAPDGFVVNSFTGDDWRACRDHVRQILGTGRAAHVAESAPSRTASHSRTTTAARLWTESVPISATLAEAYLLSRGLVLQQEAFDGRALRFHRNCPFRLLTGEVAWLPAMIAAMVDIRTNEFRGVHRTALSVDGRGKANVAELGNPKRMLGPAAGACVRLSPDVDVSNGLHIAEGIETALACMAMGFQPMWAAMSASGMPSSPCLPGSTR